MLIGLSQAKLASCCVIHSYVYVCMQGATWLFLELLNKIHIAKASLLHGRENTEDNPKKEYLLIKF